MAKLSKIERLQKAAEKAAVRQEMTMTFDSVQHILQGINNRSKAQAETNNFQKKIQ